jgi:hypothetical protein
MQARREWPESRAASPDAICSASAAIIFDGFSPLAFRDDGAQARGHSTVQTRAVAGQGATASSVSTAIVALWNLQLAESKAGGRVRNPTSPPICSFRSQCNLQNLKGPAEFESHPPATRLRSRVAGFVLGRELRRDDSLTRRSCAEATKARRRTNPTLSAKSESSESVSARYQEAHRPRISGGRMMFAFQPATAQPTAMSRRHSTDDAPVTDGVAPSSDVRVFSVVRACLWGIWSLSGLAGLSHRLFSPS